jgi:hypothetical protein
MNLRFIDPEEQQRDLRRKVDLACMQASQQWIDSGGRPEEMKCVAVYIGPMSLAIEGGSENARWAIMNRLRELGVVVDGAPSVTGD